ncbi:type I-E CRISPR-associated protein Cas7/Cse4/CasC [Bradyrhizobium centrolobii]|uniref:Type I-E CRISPR-associated protein Cas7/Cse4/CasC n=1 Tax=Bradyrhizobium centrolobii TaxID=1505087 RepID=A0A176YDH2_9BRAD|nr:type I-E CRISPR-associated protein Cas7/Cse4/CasC [Bradyrhizobium centrolobii]OAF04033.1 type I-E CRISPR-associated protein Cas7/Cse4/CasC [Bradyrhizobium centrolobii]
MLEARFLQIHWLTSYPATLLNRDDNGLAKRLPFGDAMRTRVSSQCLKRHWRTVDDEWALRRIGPDMAVRSRETPERRILPAMQQANAGTADVIAATITAMAEQLYGSKAGERSKRQALLLGEPEIRYLCAKAIEIGKAAHESKAAEEAVKKLFKTQKGNLAALRERSVLEAGLEAALFGRMVTSDPEANTDAAIHVAHAFTVHSEASESDYFTVVDDLTHEAGDAGTAGLFDTELTAGLFYGYVVVDIPLLVSNLGDDAVLGGKAVEHLIHLIAKVTPGAKKGSTAPYSYAEMMLVEAGHRQPRTLANAFRKPVTAQSRTAIAALSDHIKNVDQTYGLHETRRHLSIDKAHLSGSTLVPLNDLAAFAGEIVAATPVKA